jgi:putative aldouronate transport system substrate-binding protein
MLSEEWQKILSWGIQGEDYLVVTTADSTGLLKCARFRKDLVWRASNKLEALLDVLPKHQGTFSDGNAFGPDDQPEEFFVTLSDYDKNFLNA